MVFPHIRLAAPLDRLRKLPIRLPLDWEDRCARICWLATVLAGGFVCQQAAAQATWEYTPYEVQVWLGVGAEVPLGAASQERLQQQLLHRAESVIQAAWQVSIDRPPDSLAVEVSSNLEWIDFAQLEAAAPDALRRDKLILLSIQGDPREFVVEAREIDCRTRLFGPVVRRRTRQPQQLAATAFDAVVEAFAALVRIEDGQDRSLTVRVRAGGLILDPSSPAFVAEGEILQPIIRRNDRVGRPQSIAPVDWTFLQVARRDSSNPSLLEVAVHSSWRSPIRGRVGSRREQYALVVRPAATQTQIRIEAKVPRGGSPYPLPGLEIYAREPSTEPPPGTAEESAAAEQRNPLEFLGFTDWRGAIAVQAVENPLRVVYIKNGGQLLARLPLVPGLDPQRIAQVADDGPRLEAEGFLRGFNGELMDVVAQRRILAAQIRQRIANEQPAEAEQLLEKFRQLPSRNDMQRRLEQQRNRQTESSNRTVQARIANLYAETSRALTQYLDPELGTELLAELNAARQGG